MQENVKLDITPTEQRMANDKLSKLVFSYSLPTIIGMLVNALYNVVDRYWVGKIPGPSGKYALTGIGLCMPIMNVIAGAALLVGVGAAATISIRLGRKEREDAEKILGNAISLSLILSFIVTVLGLVFAEKILLLMHADENSMPFALSYIRIILLGCFMMLSSFAINHTIRATGNPKRFASTQLLGATVNMILDPILIFYFKLGVEGAAYATIFAQFVSAIWVFSYYFSKNPALKIHIKNLVLKFKIVEEIFAIGVSPFIMQVIGSFIAIIANRSLMHYGGIEIGDGGTAVGAFTVIISILTLFFMPVLGINQGVQPIIGYNYGAENYKRVKDALKYAIIYAVIICTFGFIVVQAFAPFLIQIFNDDEQLVAVGSVGLRIFLFALPAIGFQVPASNFFQAIGRAKMSIILSLLRQVFLLVPAYLILPKFFGLTGVWMAGPFSDIISSIITFILLKREFKILT